MNSRIFFAKPLDLYLFLHFRVALGAYLALAIPASEQDSDNFGRCEELKCTLIKHKILNENLFTVTALIFFWNLAEMSAKVFSIFFYNRDFQGSVSKYFLQ